MSDKECLKICHAIYGNIEINHVLIERVLDSTQTVTRNALDELGVLQIEDLPLSWQGFGKVKVEHRVPRGPSEPDNHEYTRSREILYFRKQISLRVAYEIVELFRPLRTGYIPHYQMVRSMRGRLIQVKIYTPGSFKTLTNPLGHLPHLRCCHPRPSDR